MTNCGILDVDNTFAIEMYSVDQVFRSMYDVNKVPEYAKFVHSLSKKRTDGNNRITTNYRFNIHVWKDLNNINYDDRKTSPRSYHSIQFLKSHAIYSVEETLQSLDNKAFDDKQYMLMSLFAEKVSGECEENFICISSLLGSWTNKDFSIHIVSVSNALYKKQKFGRGGDGISFRDRGIGSFMVGLATSMS
jgi:hypothetical protein